MAQPWQEPFPGIPKIHLLLAYVADLEVEVDRLRKQGQFVLHESQVTLNEIQSFCTPGIAGGSPESLTRIEESASRLSALLRDAQDLPGYHPAQDQVIAITFRPLVEQMFRWQQRLLAAQEVVLRLELECEHVEWFPGRLRHILDNLLSNALKYRDPTRSQSWVRLGLRPSPQGYELRISDNGMGLPSDGQAEVLELFYRAAPTRTAGLGVGLAVAKLLVEQSGGTLTVDSARGQGTTFVAWLPRFDVADFLT